MTVIKKLFQILKIIKYDFWDRKISFLAPPSPQTINLLVNDVCNSHCQMCLIWQNEKSVELSPHEFKTVLSNDLFKNVRYVGVSGGEPTLRKDLPAVFHSICTSLPKIIGTGIITNGIITGVVKKQVLDCYEICKSHGVSFSVMFSLDGLNEIHDLVRGRKGNFKSTISLIDFFHNETDIPTSFGCTITSDNALFVDELLDYAKENNLYGRFRIAEYIDRLYNSEQVEYIRKFPPKVAYHLGLFFFRAEHDFEKSFIFKKTYHNIRKMIAEQQPRQIGCPYQINSVVLTSRGELLYCSPKSPILGNTLKQSAKEIYFSNLQKRRSIIENHCSSCIHDYHEQITLQDIQQYVYKRFKKKTKYNCLFLLQQSKFISKKRIEYLEDTQNLSSNSVLIVGWYGTETVGDKAILWSIIQELRSRKNPPKKIYLSSLYPFVSTWTIQEMNLGEIEVIETYSLEFEKVIKTVPEIIVGGGPLMDLEPLNHILYAFIQNLKKQSNGIRRILGCGIGPLNSPKYASVVSEILRLSTHISLRDKASLKRAFTEFSITSGNIIPDPATNYVLYVKEHQNDLLKSQKPPLGKDKNIACFLREWGVDYCGSLTEAEYLKTKDKFEDQLIKMLIFLSKKQQAKVNLLPMHCFSIGGDDRVFNRFLSRKILSQSEDVEVNFSREPTSPLEILQTMYDSKINICMRFHSVLFAETLGVPFLAIDYTQGGKIKAFLEDRNKVSRLISLEDIASGNWHDIIYQLFFSSDKNTSS
jgi:MoaA/NifB/PqqE/SkfB family radical SAM enzyme/polysaccharide pyruvyl transferase WcaK-like protein